MRCHASSPEQPRPHSDITTRPCVSCAVSSTSARATNWLVIYTTIGFLFPEHIKQANDMKALLFWHFFVGRIALAILGPWLEAIHYVVDAKGGYVLDCIIPIEAAVDDKLADPITNLNLPEYPAFEFAVHSSMAATACPADSAQNRQAQDHPTTCQPTRRRSTSGSIVVSTTRPSSWRPMHHNK